MAANEKEKKKEKVYLDTFVFMDILSGNPDTVQRARVYLDQISGNELHAVISSVMLTEISFHIKKKYNREKIEEILYYIQSLPNLEIIDVSPDIAKRAGLLRAKYRRKIPKKLTYFDCVHLATALNEKCSRFITGDRGFRNIFELEIEIY